MAHYLALILAYLLERVGDQVANWTLRQVIEYFQANPTEAKDCSRRTVEEYVSSLEDNDGPYFWETKR